MAPRSAGTTLSPDAQLPALIARLDAKQQTLVRALRTALRKRFPTLNELAYDYATSLVIAYSPTENGIHAIVSIGARGDGVRLNFTQGATLPDPKKLLTGSGTQARYLVIDAASRLAHPDVETLIDAATRRATVALPDTGKGRLVLKSDSAAKPARAKGVRRG